MRRLHREVRLRIERERRQRRGIEVGIRERDVRSVFVHSNLDGCIVAAVLAGGGRFAPSVEQLQHLVAAVHGSIWMRERVVV